MSLPTSLPTKDSSDLDLTSCYGFIGYAKSNGSKDIVDVTKIKATNDLTFYAAYEDNVSVYDPKVVLTDDYLKFTLYQSSKTCEIGVKPGVVLEGKITLPVSYTSNG